MLKLLGLNAKTFRAAALAASLETGQARALEHAKTLAGDTRAGKALGPPARHEKAASGLRSATAFQKGGA